MMSTEDAIICDIGNYQEYLNNASLTSLNEQGIHFLGVLRNSTGCHLSNKMGFLDII